MAWDTIERMAYYFISPTPDQFQKFLDRHKELKSGFWIKNSSELQSSLEKDDSHLFIVHLSGDKKIANDHILTIRKKSSKIPIVVVSEELTTAELKTHQSGSSGGDAYIKMQIEPSALLTMLEGLLPSQAKNLSQEAVKLDMGFGNKEQLEYIKNHPLSLKMDAVFSKTGGQSNDKPLEAPPQEFELPPVGDIMSDKDQELSLEELGDLELSTESEPAPEVSSGGLELNLSMEEEAPADAPIQEKQDQPSVSNTLLSFEEEDEGSAVDLAPTSTNVGAGLSLEADEDTSSQTALGSLEEEEEVPEPTALKLTSDILAEGTGLSLDFTSDTNDLSEDVKEKLKEIDEMEASTIRVGIPAALAASDNTDGHLKTMTNEEDSDLDVPLVSPDLDLDSLDFGGEDQPTRVATLDSIKESSKKKKKEELPPPPVEEDEPTRIIELPRSMPVFTGDMERTQATISNLRADREELLARIQKLEDEKLLQNRQSLTMRAELDEKKIELSIIRKKLNDEINELKDKFRLHDERRILLEERNRVLVQELDKANQKNKIDVKKVGMREKELEQKLELLKSDAETQIRHRDLKILELKRKIDAMEFDMESMSMQEKRSVDSRYELEDKLDKAIKTLRSAITVLEDETEKSHVLDALKKNIDM